MHRTRIERAARNSSIVLALLAAIGSASFATGQDNELDRITKRVETLKQVVHDQFISEKELHDASDELGDMLARTNELARGAAEQNLSKQLVEVQAKILPLLTYVHERLPEPDSSERPVVRRAPRAGIGMPQFDSKKLIGRLAEAALKAQYRLSRHLNTSSPDTSTTEKLMVEMILAEEALAWEVGWPFTTAEITKIKAAGDKLTEEVYLSRRDRGLERINDRVRIDYEGVGRTPPPAFVVHHSTDSAVRREVQQQLKALRGITADWDRGTTAFDEHEQLVLLGKSTRSPESDEVVKGEDPPKAADDQRRPTIDELFPPSNSPSKHVRPAARPAAEPRMWMDKSGKFRVHAVFVSLIGDKIRLKREDNGKTIELKLSELSNADQRYVAGLK